MKSNTQAQPFLPGLELPPAGEFESVGQILARMTAAPLPHDGLAVRIEKRIRRERRERAVKK